MNSNKLLAGQSCCLSSFVAALAANPLQSSASSTLLAFYNQVTVRQPRQVCALFGDLAFLNCELHHAGLPLVLVASNTGVEPTIYD